MALAHMVCISVRYEGLSSVSVFTDRNIAHLHACKLANSLGSSNDMEEVVMVTFDEGKRVLCASYSGSSTQLWFAPESD